jgi:hypothetical protein
MLCFVTLDAKNTQFILAHDGLIDKRAQDKINQIGQEVKEKLNTSVFTYVMENNGIDMELPREQRITQMREYDKKIIEKLGIKNNYVVLVLIIDQMYANILVSPNLNNIIDKNDILDGYVVPLLASKDKNTLFAKTSAATLNGYAQIADSIAKSKNIQLDSSIGSSGKTAGTIWKVFMYSVVLFGILAYAYVILRQRKGK